jgi:SHS2 domain-containing protein
MKNLTSKKYQILHHPADLKIKAYGKNLKELFENLFLGIKEGTRPEILKEEVINQFQINSENFENLIFDFLAELVYQMDFNDAFYQKVEFQKESDKELVGKIFGYKVKRFTTEIKGVTWYDFEIKKENNNFILTVVFDV